MLPSARANDGSKRWAQRPWRNVETQQDCDRFLSCNISEPMSGLPGRVNENVAVTTDMPA